MQVLHIATWFPNKENPTEALWIARHIESLKGKSENVVWHVETYENERFTHVFSQEKEVLHWRIGLPTKRWILIEICTFLQLLFLAITKRSLIKKSSIVNFHIAYPSLTFWNFLKVFYPKKIVVTEHWSAYHFNFGVKNKLARVQKILSHKIPLISVSEALKEDIINYSGYQFKTYVIPNVVNTEIFNYQKSERSREVFFMLSKWKTPKKPLAIVKEFENYLQTNPEAELRIGGYGPLEDEILAYIRKNNLEKKVNYLGRLDSVEIVKEFCKATAFIHVSDYETFSVVCAEALCCGCPVIVSKVGGIVEFVSESNGKFIGSETDVFLDLDKIKNLNREQIARSAQNRFSSKTVGEAYYQVLEQIISNEG